MIKTIQQLPKEKKQQVLLTVVLCLVATVVVANFIVRPQLSAVRDATAKIEELRQKIGIEETKARMEAGNATARDQYAAFLEQQDRTMVSGDPFSWVVREMSLLAEGHSVKVLSLRPGAMMDHGRVEKFKTYGTRIELTGSYDDVGAFVSAIENKYPTADVRSVSFQAGAVGSTTLHASMEVMFIMKQHAVGSGKSGEKSS
jgi:Tfp pilus assembly protein PilO